MTTGQQREAFEAWYPTICETVPDFERDGGGEYLSPFIFVAWEAYQAGSAAPAAARAPRK